MLKEVNVLTQPLRNAVEALESGALISRRNPRYGLRPRRDSLTRIIFASTAEKHALSLCMDFWILSSRWAGSHKQVHATPRPIRCISRCLEDLGGREVTILVSNEATYNHTNFEEQARSFCSSNQIETSVQKDSIAVL